MLVAAAEAASSTDGTSLLNKELDNIAIQSTLGVVYVYHCLGNLIGCVDILFVITPHLRYTLVNAAPSLNI